MTHPDFDDWIEHCFNHPVTDPQWHFSTKAPTWNAPNSITIQYLIRLFEHPCEALERFSDEQVNQGLWYIIHNACSDHMYVLVDTKLAIADRVACMSALSGLYSKLFLSRCSDDLSHGKRPEPASALNSICYMLWDVLPYMPAPENPEQRAIDDAGLAVLSQALRLPSIACQESALHGLGHWSDNYPDETAVEINRFIERNDAPPELLSYARAALIGNIL